MERIQELFEKWVMTEAKRRGYVYAENVLLKSSNGDYRTTWVDCAWIGWRAAVLAGLNMKRRPTNRTALLVAQDLAQLALAATGWRRQVYWRAAMGEMRRAYNLEAGQ